MNIDRQHSDGMEIGATPKSEFEVMEYLRANSNFWWSTGQFWQVWVGIMLRRLYSYDPTALQAWRPAEGWAKVLEWRKLPHEWKPDDSEYSERERTRRARALVGLDDPLTGAVRGVMKAGDNRIGSNNPWSIMVRTVPGKCVPKEEFTVGRVRTLKEDLNSNRDWFEGGLTSSIRNWDTKARSVLEFYEPGMKGKGIARNMSVSNEKQPRRPPGLKVREKLWTSFSR
jgi:hypothetical protein